MSDGPKRRTPPLPVKLTSALRQLEDAMRRLGEIPADAGKVEWQFDHHPPLGVRPINEAGTDWIPPQHDPSRLFWLPQPAHKDKTYGVNTHISVGSDRHTIDHTRRLETAMKETLQRVADRLPGEKCKPKGTIPARKKLPRQRKQRRTEAERSRMESDNG